MWTALNITNTTTFDKMDGFEVYLKETATVTAFLYDTIANGVLGTQGYTQSTFNGVEGWNRFLFTTPQQLNVNTSVVLVLNIVSSTSTHAISYNYTDTTPSGRSYANSRQGGTFQEISADNGDLNQHALMSSGDSAEMTTATALAQITNENFKTCLSALISAQSLTLASQVTSVDCSGKSVNTITGIENFANLSSLNLSTNQIINVSNLDTLHLNNNQIVDISTLTTLVKLVTLQLNNNSIVDISKLSTLTALTTLNLSSNQIALITALSSLTALQSLEIESNQLTDLTPLMPTFVLTMTTLKLLGNDTLACWQMDYIEKYGSITSWVRSASCDSGADSEDSDGDGLTNRAELTAGTNPAKADTDGDGKNDNVDILPLDSQRWTNTDTDGDTFTDDVETLLGLDINDAADVWIDADGDRLPLVLELQNSKDKDVKDNDVFNNVTLLVNQAFVDMQYKFATSDELTFWTDRLTTKAGTPVDLYSTALTETDFAFMGFIGRTYLAVMLREPDLGGIRFHFGKLKGGGTQQDVVDSFVASGEFQTRYGSLTNAEFVNLVYTNVLGRGADTDGLAFWVGELDAASHTRGSMMLQFIESAEFITTNDEALRIDVLSQILTGSRPVDHERVTYKAWLVSEGNSSSILKTLLASDGNRNNLMATITAGAADTDSDGIPDGVEFTDNIDPATKSNDINNDDALFVKQVMRDMLGEPWEFASVTAQNAALTAAGSRSAWVKGLLDNDGFKNKRQSISRLYFAFFLRRSDHAGLMFWIGRRETDLAMTGIAVFFVTSDEFQSLYGSLSNGDFVSLVYQNVLSRAPDDAGLAFWTGQLDSSAISRGGLMVRFSESTENLTST
jgi:Leucine-rich repeat (LRR) protein